MASTPAIRTVQLVTMRRPLATSVRLARKLVLHVTPPPPTALPARTSPALSTTSTPIMSVIKLVPTGSTETAATTNALPATMSAPSASEPVPPTALNAKLTPALTTSCSTAAPVAFPLVPMATTQWHLPSSVCLVTPTARPVLLPLPTASLVIWKQVRMSILKAPLVYRTALMVSTRVFPITNVLAVSLDVLHASEDN